jgi:hypothetical protein
MEEFMKVNKLHKIILLSLILCFIFIGSVNAATTFSDLPNDWSKDFITRASELDFVKGFNDNTFGPDKNVTRFDSMLMLSRLHKIDDDMQKQIENKYLPLIKEVTNGSDDWAYSELSKALALGLLSETNFKNLYKNGFLKKEATREDIAVFIVKAMCLQKEVDALKDKLYSMPFNDSVQINSDYRPYVYLSYDKEIFSGDTNKNFNPKKSITRKELAKIVCNAYDYIKKNNITPEFSDFETFSTFKGTIEKITINSIESYIEVKPDNSSSNLIVKFRDGATTIKINKTVSTISKLEKGMAVECTISTKDAVAKQIVVDTTVTSVDGKIKSVYFSAPMRLVITNKNNEEQQFNISNDVVVTLDGKNIEFKNLAKNDLVSIRLVDNTVTQINATSRLQVYSGKIKSIQYDIPIKLTLEDKAGKTYTFVYTQEPYVTRNSILISFDQLRVGDEATIKTEYDTMTAIDAKSVATPSDSIAVIKEITIGASNQIKLEGSDGVTKEYRLSNTAKISVLNTSSSIYDLRVGYKVKVGLDGTEITSIEADAAETSQQLNGKIVYIYKPSNLSLEKSVIILQVKNNLNENEIVYLNLNSNSIIMNLAAQKIRISDLAQGMNVICVGSYSGGTFNVVSIIVK